MTAHPGTDDGLEVRVTGGVVRGVREGSVHAWRGMPYAAPPTGERRFRALSPVIPWPDVLDASKFGAIAPQARARRLLGPMSSALTADEDCLTVNVSAPIRDPGGTLLPVMVFIHGGGYGAGSSRDFSGQGEGFVRSGRVVYVSFNYRLGALGYLDFTRYDSVRRRFENNLGLRDQVALLRWVRENIGAFGGDAERVTVFGESAGGNAVTTLMATPSARGLFAGAIAQSPPPDAVYSPDLTARWAAEFVALLRDVVRERSEPDRMRGEEDVPRDAAASATPQQLLTEATADDLVAASVALQVRTPDFYAGAFCFAPVVDGDTVPERPFVAFREGRAHRVPLIIGTNDREGTIFRGRVDILPRTGQRIDDLFAEAPGESRQAMRAAYPDLSARRSAADFGGDFGFWYPSTRVADTGSRFAPVWSYRFDFAPRLLKLVGLDATHGVEMFALFDRTDVPLARVITSLGGYEEYAAAGERMRQHWLRFVETGAPGPAWPRYDEQTRSTLVIDDSDRVEADPRSERRRAWDAFMPSLAG
ncbi:carboxylesterase/lipase family protein [Agromyces humatus]|uniref:Carboxylic ester hydrolase n=1 Tax=Agromyces humatus TaxID=279573 RepID=A0ABP4WGC4_9MICO|nr:carboxylesterase/lipase family protein [Agromyces humatus]